MNSTTVVIRDVETEGYPSDDDSAVFYFDGCWVSGWPLSHWIETDDAGNLLWAANEDVGRTAQFHGVRYWTTLPAPG